MCGIFGVVVSEGRSLPPASLHKTVDALFKLSETRGKEAAGIAIRTLGSTHVHKQPHPASVMIRSAEYRELLSRTLPNGGGEPIAVIGHSRLVTNGHQLEEVNNQPVQRSGITGVHNGIVVNHDQLWGELDVEPQSEVDSEVILALLHETRTGDASIADATQETFRRLEGAASVAVVFDDEPKVVLATNTGSLYVCEGAEPGLMIFASEQYIVRRLLKDPTVGRLLDGDRARQMPSRQGMVIDLESGETRTFELTGRDDIEGRPRQVRLNRDVRPETTPLAPPESLRRCSKCVLPETMPYIEFDAHGVCNYCRDYVPMQVAGRDALEALVEPYRSQDGSPDCIVAFSGGRDSSYGLHYIKTGLGLNPITMTYDWGMVTDLARRNQARVCGKLGIEQILISADIDRKRRYIHQNIKAWMRKPSLGMIPLFMAGDKYYFYYIDRVRKQTGLDLGFFSVNPMEATYFKQGFAGFGGRVMKNTLGQSLKLLTFYGGQYLSNPAYINSSMLDTAGSFACTYFRPRDFCYLFRYIRWNEDEVTETLVREYDWELAPDTQTTWRIGDGTASFYNYIYYTVAGFSEHDTFRSNQVREGVLTRDQALALTAEDNLPRFETMREYCDLVDIDFDEVKGVIDSMPKLY